MAESTVTNQAVCGVGMQVSDIPPFRVKSCQIGGPAHRSGDITAGDILLAIDGVSASGLSFTDVRKLIIGADGSSVEMQFLRNRGEENRTFTVSMIRSAAVVVDPSDTQTCSRSTHPLLPTCPPDLLQWFHASSALPFLR